jgi:hypothetical protein
MDSGGAKPPRDAVHRSRKIVSADLGIVPEQTAKLTYRARVRRLADWLEKASIAVD